MWRPCIIPHLSRDAMVPYCTISGSANSAFGFKFQPRSFYGLEWHLLTGVSFLDQPHGSGRRSSNMCSSVPFGFDMALFKARLARSLQKSIALPKTHMDPGRMGPERWFFLYKPVVFRVHVSFPGTLCHCPCDPDSMNNGSWWSFRSQTLDDPCTSASRFPVHSW